MTLIVDSEIGNRVPNAGHTYVRAPEFALRYGASFRLTSDAAPGAAFDLMANGDYMSKIVVRVR